MIISNILTAHIRSRILLFFFVLMFVPGLGPAALSADTTHQEFQKILRDSLADLWAGQEFSPELILRQQRLRDMLANGAVNKPELEGMLASAFLSILDRQKTSRYILKTFPGRFSALLSPHMDWNRINQILWQAMTSVINKENPFLVKVGSLAPPGTPWYKVSETTVIPHIKKLSGGKILIRIYGAGVMGEDTDVLKKIDEGQLNCCGCTALGFLAACPEASVFFLPGLFANYEEVDFIFDTFRKRLDEAFQKRGYDVWTIIDTGNFYLFSTKPVTGLSDIKQSRVLAWFGILETSFYQELGINALPIAVPDIILALGRGQADTYMAPAAWALGMQAYQYTTCYLKPSILYSPGGIIVHLKIKDELQKLTGASATFVHNIVEIIVSENYTIEQDWKRRIRSYEEKSLNAFETKCGIQAITLSPDDRQAIEKAGKAVQQKLTGKLFPADLVNDIQKALAEYRANQ